MPTQLPSPKQVAEKMQHALTECLYDYDNENQYDGVRTISHWQFHALAKRTDIARHFYAEVEVEAARIGLIVAFGQNAVVIATDDDFAPNGWSEIKPDIPGSPGHLTED